jgi:hypothetical protein
MSNETFSSVDAPPLTTVEKPAAARLGEAFVSRLVIITPLCLAAVFLPHSVRHRLQDIAVANGDRHSALYPGAAAQ